MTTHTLLMLAAGLGAGILLIAALWPPRTRNPAPSPAPEPDHIDREIDQRLRRIERYDAIDRIRRLLPPDRRAEFDPLIPALLDADAPDPDDDLP